MPGNSIGTRLVLTSFGESHGKCVGTVLDGCPAGLELDESDIQGMLDQRRPGQSGITTQRKEGDRVEILSGTFRGYTTGAPIAMIIWNEDQKSSSYDELTTKLRPGHADYPAMIKYAKFNDHRGGGRFSGRLTATHVMGGAVARKLLRKVLGVETRSYTVRIGGVAMEGKARRYATSSIYSNNVRCPDARTAARMESAILKARSLKDSLGGVIESVTTGLPVGLGEPIFGSLESDLSRAIYAIPSVKGVEFGSGFAGSSTSGSANNDTYLIRRNRILTKTNNAGGILGGLSTGMPIIMRVAFKPASSIPREQKTVNVETQKSDVLRVEGRHDPCVVPRAPPVVDSLVSLVVADRAIERGLIGQVI